jgi:hypothetical protein
MIALDCTKAGLLYAWYDALVKQHLLDHITIEALLDSSACSALVGLITRAVDELVANRFLEEEDLYTSIGRTGFGRYRITNKGIRYVEEKLQHCKTSLSDVLKSAEKAAENEPDRWKRADFLGELPASRVDELRALLLECISVIRQANLSQQDRADAEQRIKAAQEATEAPNPPLKVVVDLIKPFSSSFLGELAKKIVNLIFGS